MKSTAPNTNDEIEVVEEQSGPWGRVRIRENQGLSGIQKCSIFLTPDQLKEHARECLGIAAKIQGSKPPESFVRECAELGFEIGGWDESVAGVFGHGAEFVGSHAEVMAFLRGWIACEMRQ